MAEWEGNKLMVKLETGQEIEWKEEYRDWEIVEAVDESKKSIKVRVIMGTRGEEIEVRGGWLEREWDIIYDGKRWEEGMNKIREDTERIAIWNKDMIRRIKDKTEEIREEERMVLQRKKKVEEMEGKSAERMRELRKNEIEDEEEEQVKMDMAKKCGLVRGGRTRVEEEKCNIM